MAAAALGSEPARRPPDRSLFLHQQTGAARLTGILRIWDVALLTDATGTGKTRIALDVARDHQGVCILVPAALKKQWERESSEAGVHPVHITTHEHLSNGGSLPSSQLIIVDEAHRFRNPQTRRYASLAEQSIDCKLLLITATPVVNEPADLASILRLKLPDSALSFLGVPSLERDSIKGGHEMARASLPLTVSRGISRRLALTLPATNASQPIHEPPVPLEYLGELIEGLESIRFAWLDNSGRRMIALHLIHRLSSSRAALETSLLRLARLLDAMLVTGEPFHRIRTLSVDLGRECFQLNLMSGLEVASRARNHDLQQELARVSELRAWLSAIPKSDPRLIALRDIASSRKTLSFTCCIATARDIAVGLGWKGLGVASGRGSWIASGRVGVEELLDRFAPRARGARCPEPIERVNHLVATDLASEGLNLQDAERVVHVDLPWHPLRLVQRQGRAIRAGSPHESVRVHWMIPHPLLECRLNMTGRLGLKGRFQKRLGSPTIATVGDISKDNRLCRLREDLVATADSSTGNGFAVVEGDKRLCVAALRWILADKTVRELVALEGPQLTPVCEAERIFEIAIELLSYRPVDNDPDEGALRSLVKLVQGRMRMAEFPQRSPAIIALSREVAKTARCAARARDLKTLQRCAEWSERIRCGLTEGEIIRLRDALERGGEPTFEERVGVVVQNVELEGLIVSTVNGGTE